MIKNIIPAIASTNALAAAAAVNEALKLATDAAPYLKNCLMYNGEDGAFVSTQQYFKNPDCTVCGKPNVAMTVPASLTLQGKKKKRKEKCFCECFVVTCLLGVFDMLGDHKVFVYSCFLFDLADS